MTRMLETALALALLAGTASAADLDAALVQKPTLRSEFANGTEAGFACSRIADAIDLNRCFDRVRDRQRASNPGSDAFELGLAFTHWRLAAILKGVYDDSPIQNAVQKRGAWAFASGAKADVLRRQKALGVTDEQMAELIGSAWQEFTAFPPLPPETMAAAR